MDASVQAEVWIRELGTVHGRSSGEIGAFDYQHAVEELLYLHQIDSVE